MLGAAHTKAMTVTNARSVFNFNCKFVEPDNDHNHRVAASDVDFKFRPDRQLRCIFLLYGPVGVGVQFVIGRNNLMKPQIDVLRIVLSIICDEEQLDYAFIALYPGCVISKA